MQTQLTSIAKMMALFVFVFIAIANAQERPVLPRNSAANPTFLSPLAPAKGARHAKEVKTAPSVVVQMLIMEIDDGRMGKLGMKFDGVARDVSKKDDLENLNALLSDKPTREVRTARISSVLQDQLVSTLPKDIAAVISRPQIHVIDGDEARVEIRAIEKESGLLVGLSIGVKPVVAGKRVTLDADIVRTVLEGDDGGNRIKTIQADVNFTCDSGESYVARTRERDGKSLLLFFTPTVLRDTPTLPHPPHGPRATMATERNAQLIELRSGESRIVRLGFKISDFVSDHPTRVTAEPAEDDSLALKGLERGMATLRAADEDGKIHTFDVVVGGDTRELEHSLTKLFPQWKVEAVELNGSAVVLRGTIERAEDQRKVIEVAEQFYPNVITHLGATTPLIPHESASLSPDSVAIKSLPPAPAAHPRPERTTPKKSGDELQAIRAELKGLRKDVARLISVLESRQ